MTDQHHPSKAVTTECDLPDAPEKVWKALTEAKLLAVWLMPNDIAPEAPRLAEGDRFHLRPQGAADGSKTSPEAPRDAVECEVLTAEPNRLLRYRWRENEGGDPLDSIVTFELTPTTTGGTHLRVVHSDFQLGTVVAFPARATRATRQRMRKNPIAMSSAHWSTRWAA